jgi:hypothetical protein
LSEKIIKGDGESLKTEHLEKKIIVKRKSILDEAINYLNIFGASASFPYNFQDLIFELTRRK